MTRKWWKKPGPVVFNCTPEFPYSIGNVVKYAQAMGGLEPGKVHDMNIRHDGEQGEPCPNCGVTW